MAQSDDLALPAALDAERAVLGAVLLDGTLYPAAAELGEHDFDRPRHRVIWSAMQAVHADGLTIDNVTVREALVRRGAFDDRIDVDLVDCMLAPAMASNLPHYVAVVADRSARRRAIAVFQGAIGDVLDGAADLGTVLAGVQSEAGKLLAGGRSTHMRSDDLVLSTLKKIQHAHEQREQNGALWVPGLSSGIPALDATIGGFARGDYHIIGGETSMGKSAFALGRALGFALDDHPGVFVSLEDQSYTMGLRLLAARSAMSAQELRFGVVRDLTGWQRLTDAGTATARLPIRWEFSCYTLPAILRALRVAREESGAEWAVVDYLQLVGNPKPGRRTEQSRALELAEISQALRVAAKDLNMAILALSQLRRLDGRNARRPALSDLRDSGSLEQDASTVIFVSRPGKDAPAGTDLAREWPAEKTELIVAKNKNGPRLDIHLRFVESTMTFVPWIDQEVI